MKGYQAYTVETYNKCVDLYEEIRRPLLLSTEIEKFTELLNGNKLLDAGTGPGRDANHFSELGYNVYAIDLSWNFLLMNAKRKGKVDYMMMDVEFLSFAEDTFNGVWCNAVLSHFKKSELIKPLSEISRILKKDGVLFLSVKEGNSEGVEIAEELDNLPRYMSYFTAEEITSCLVDAGFLISIIYPYNEKKAFGNKHRDVNFLFCFALKL